MEGLFRQIKNEIIRLLKGLDPDIDVFFEEIKSIDEEHGATEDETYYFIDFVPRSNTVDRDYTDIGIMVDVAYHEKNESNTAYLMKADELDDVFLPVFSFGDRHITVPDISHSIVDHVLHSNFTLSFRKNRQETARFDLMDELNVAIQKEESV